MRDWSSDVCSSDLRRPDRAAGNPGLNRTPLAQFHEFRVDLGAHHVFEQTAVAHALDGTVQFESAGRTGQLVPEIACDTRSEEHTSELQSLMRISYAVFCLKKKKKKIQYAHR